MDHFLNITEFEAFALISPEECFVKSIRLLFVFGRGNSAIFVTNQDKVYGIGHNRNGGLGLGHQKEDFRRPTINPILSGKQLVDICAGFEHCIALTAEGKCYSWGTNKYGQLGIGSQKSTATPTLIESLADERVVQICCGAYHSLALTLEGDVFSWGHNTFAQLGDRTYNSRDVPTQVLINEAVQSISSGVNHSMALSRTGMVYVWGANTCGQLGRNPELDQRNREKPMSNRPKLVSGLENVVIKKAVCGPNHNLILTADGRLYTFGDNTCGQVGNGTTEPQFTPKKLNKEIKIKEIYSHYDNDLSIAVSEDNKCFVWGLASNEKVLRPKPIDNSSVKSIFDLYAKYAKNQITFKAINIEDISSFVVKSTEEEVTENNINSNRKESLNSLKDYEKEVNISVKNEFNIEKRLSSNLKTEKQTNFFGLQTVVDQNKAPVMSSKTVSGREFLRRLEDSFNNRNNYDIKICSDDNVIYCHKTILQIRNDNFWQILSQNLNEDNNEIRINPKTYDLFYAFLQYMYGIDPEINEKNVKEIQSMAKIFCESELEELCTELIRKTEITIDLSNVCTLYEKAINEGLTDLEEKCVQFATDNYKSVLRSDAFDAMDDSLSKRFMISIHK